MAILSLATAAARGSLARGGGVAGLRVRPNRLTRSALAFGFGGLPSSFSRATAPRPPRRQLPRACFSTGGGLEGLSVSELKNLLAERDVDYRDCIEKKELVARLETAMREGRPTNRGASLGGGLMQEEDRTVKLFEKASPSVVFIETAQQVRQPFSMRALEVPQGTGSGFIWDNQGHVVTNYHVVQSAVKQSRGGKVKVTLQGGSKSFDAELVGAEPEKDLAVLRVVAPQSLLAPIDVGSSSSLLVGQKVFAIGNPFGLDHTLTMGIVSALGREVNGAGGRPLKGCVQTDAAINPGNSGGPLLDSAGKLIGVNTAILSSSGASAGIGFAIPVDTVRRIVTQLIRYGRVVRPSLGVQVAEDSLMANIERSIGAKLEGVMVVETPPGSPASNPVQGSPIQGLARRGDGSMALGDVITKVNGLAVSKVEDLLCAIEESEIGAAVALSVKRRGTGQETIVSVKLREHRQLAKL